MKRRQFIHQAGVAGSAFLLAPGIITIDKGKPIGVQLYSIREQMSTNPVATIGKLAKMGFKEVEAFGLTDGRFFGMTAKDFKRALDNTGLTMPSTHHIVGIGQWNRSSGQLTDELKRAIDTFAEVGVKQVVCPFIVKAQRPDDAFKRLCEIFNRTGDFCSQKQMRFAYHNHDFEFVSEGGAPLMYDTLLRETDSKLVDLQLDLYWVAYTGHDPVKWMEKTAGRVTSFHVKDMAPPPDRKTIEVGEGTINFAEIFAHPTSAFVKYYIVELEHYKRTPMEGVEVSLKNLQKLLS